MRAVRPADVAAAARRSLGLGSEPGNVVPDDAFLATSLRRLAGILCPCPPAALVTRLTGSLGHLFPGDDAELKHRVEDVLELLVAGGDLLELAQVAAGDDLPGTTLFAAPPGFVPLQGGAVVLVGLTPDDPTPLPALLQGKARQRGTLREIAAEPSLNVADTLAAAGWRRISREAWLRSPPPQTPADHAGLLAAKLSAAPRGGSVEDLRILDPERPIHFYRGRWTKPGGRTGRFVCRRPQAYGADLWCYVELRGGRVERQLELPLPGSRYRGCDEAWRLQFALDHLRGRPQEYQARHAANGEAVFGFFSPLPVWGQRHLALNGRPGPRGEGHLFAWGVDAVAAADLEDLLRHDLWLARAGHQG